MNKWLIAGVLMLCAANQALAVGSVADVTVYDRAQNRTLPVYYHEGRYYVVGRPGHQYRIDIRSNNAARVLAVVSVDGVNAVSGETASWNQSGYVLDSRTSFGITGWRKSMERIAAFFFTELDNSYAARTGRPNNVGVVGVALFREKPAEVSVPNLSPRRRGLEDEMKRELDRESPAPGTLQAPSATRPTPPAQEKNLGTGHGAIETSVVRYTNFERASQAPDEVITLYYDSYRNLVAQGVITERTRVAQPNPFPGQFVPDPR